MASTIAQDRYFWNKTSATDFNAVTDAGFFAIYGASNAPNGEGHYILLSGKFDDNSNFTVQIAVKINSPTRIYCRTSFNGTFGSWYTYSATS